MKMAQNLRYKKIQNSPSPRNTPNIHLHIKQNIPEEMRADLTAYVQETRKEPPKEMETW